MRLFLVLKRSLLLHLAERRVKREERKNKEKKERGREGEGKSWLAKTIRKMMPPFFYFVLLFSIRGKIWKSHRQICCFLLTIWGGDIMDPWPWMLLGIWKPAAALRRMVSVEFCFGQHLYSRDSSLWRWVFLTFSFTCSYLFVCGMFLLDLTALFLRHMLVGKC